jgi:hypothetical protein
MAMQKWLLKKQAFDAGADWLTGGKEVDEEFDHDFDNPDTERAVVAAGWVEPADSKGGKK